jgi:hypothetical protein
MITAYLESTKVYTNPDSTYVFNLVVADECLYLKMDVSDIESVNYVVGASPIMIHFDPFSLNVSHCAEIDYMVLIDGAKISNKPFINLN